MSVRLFRSLLAALLMTGLISGGGPMRWGNQSEAVLAASAVPALQGAASTLGTMIDLGTLGETQSEALGISDAGGVVGWANTSDGYYRAFLWRHGTMTDLGTLRGAGSEALGINNAGDVVGWASTALVSWHAALWRGGTVTDLGTLAAGTYLDAYVGSQALRINDAGDVVGWASTADGYQHAFLWRGGAMTDLSTLRGMQSGAYSVAYGINDAADVVGYSVAANGYQHAFLWRGGAMTDLGTLGGPASEAYGINNAGDVVGYSETDDGYRAFLWKGGAMTDLGTLGGYVSKAYGINNAGDVVGAASTADGYDHAFLWRHGTMIDLGTLGGTQSEALGINDAGDVVGYSETADGSTHAFLWDPGYKLPWPAGQTWYYSGGPHHGRTTAIRYAVDFKPLLMPTDTDPCSSARIDRNWVIAAAAGTVRIASRSLVEIDHPDGLRTGYYHLQSDSIEVVPGQHVESGQPLGHPSCEYPRGGRPPSGVHVHFYFCKQPASPDTPCLGQDSLVLPAEGRILSRWMIHAGDANYEGTMTNGSETRTASTGQPPDANNALVSDNDSNTLFIDRAGSGSGAVVSLPAGIACPRYCTETYASPTQITLIAKAARGSLFSGWSTACSVGTCSPTATCSGIITPCVLTVDTFETVTATFKKFQLTSLSPDSAPAGSGGGTLTVNGSDFVSGSTVNWNDSARPTTFVSPTQLTATIPATDLAVSGSLATASVTVVNPDPNGGTSMPLPFTITGPGVTGGHSASAPPGGSSSVSTAPSVAGQAGVAATLTNNASGDATATVTVANYASNPTTGSIGSVDGGFIDLRVNNADPSDTIAARFYYPSTLTGAAEAGLQLLYWTGTGWAPVRSSGSADPIKDTTDNLDGTLSGGRLSVTFDTTSTPSITSLVGTVFTMTSPDTSPPTTSATLSPASPDGIQDWYVHPVTVALHPNDPDGPSDVASTKYSLDGGASWTEYTGPVSVSQDGRYTIAYYSVDRAGNRQTDQSISFKIDQTPPQVTGTPDRPADHNGWYNHPLSVNWSQGSSDSLSGIASCDPDTSFSSPDSSSAQVTGHCTDNAGNVGSGQFSFPYDATKPVISASLVPQNPAPTGWYNIATGAPTVSFPCSDATSGIDGSCPASHTFGEGANQSSSASVSDKAGNTNSAGVTGINVDLTAPTCTVTMTPSSLWPPNHKMVSVAASVVVNDAGSGPNGFTLSSITSNEGDISSEVHGFVIGQPSTSGQLLAERDGSGTGRVYTLTYTAMDKAGNTATCNGTVRVPHDQGK